MAKIMSRSFLNSEEKVGFVEHLKSPRWTDLTEGHNVRKLVEHNSSFLELALEKKLSAFGNWQELDPILLGSWARHELCPVSDLDLIFLGDDEKVFNFIEKVQEAGLKLRYRVPKDKKDWSEGVQPFDLLALLGGRATTEAGARQLDEQKKLLHSRIKNVRKNILKEVSLERKRRQKRLDSITNFLEPHIKYTPGGLRDIEQALSLAPLFADKNPNDQHALSVLQFYKDVLLLIRQRLHLESGQDILSGADQLAISIAFGAETLSDFMRAVERGLSRTFFYSEWLLDVFKSSQKAVKLVEDKNLKSVPELIKALQKQPGILMQKKVRQSLDSCFKAKPSVRLSPQQLQGLRLMLGPKSKDALIVDVFSSRLIDKLLPPVQKLVGHVQHDQYHRFTADIHLQQACRNFLKVRHSAKELGPLSFLHKELSAKDWELIGWNCLFHDLSKGDGGDHSHKGAKNVLQMLPANFISKSFKVELSWLVENHLLLSALAFKRSSISSETLKELQDHEASDKRMQRLAVFTVIDIKATNPEAWTTWKGQLLKDFLVDLRSPESLQRQKLIPLFKDKFKNVPSTVVDEFESFLLQRIPLKTLVKDLGHLQTGGSSSIQIFRLAGRTWVRFFDRTDRPGLMVSYVDRLHQAGANVLHASIHTLTGFGVYDWFQVYLPKGKEKILRESVNETLTLQKVQFDAVQVTALGSEEWLVNMKAKDQKGLLKYACYGLSQAGANIKSARVHTWGLKVEDVFRISFKGSEEDLKKNITSFFGDFQ